ncbi:hypothetical protein D3C79_1031680 [compost metagenome]
MLAHHARKAYPGGKFVAAVLHFADMAVPLPGADAQCLTAEADFAVAADMQIARYAQFGHFRVGTFQHRQ